MTLHVVTSRTEEIARRHYETALHEQRIDPLAEMRSSSNGGSGPTTDPYPSNWERTAYRGITAF